jgi:ribonuclease HI
VLIWTDGACQRNPGPGGWAALVCWEDGVVEEHSGGLSQTTNNIMEMTAALEGLRALPSGSRACVVTDSRYLHDGMTSWMAGWKRKGWKTASGDPVKNQEVWIQLEAAASDHEQVRWHWVKGHIGHALNERADVLAVAATRSAARSRWDGQSAGGVELGQVARPRGIVQERRLEAVAGELDELAVVEPQGRGDPG